MKVLKFLFPTFDITKKIYWVRTIPTIVIISFIIGVILGLIKLGVK